MPHNSERAELRAPEKPAFGSPCNGCGLCCAAEPCGVAREFIPGVTNHGPCPAMEFDAGRFWCGMIRRPGHYIGLPHPWADEMLGSTISDMLGAGEGCCSVTPSELAAENRARASGIPVNEGGGDVG